MIIFILIFFYLSVCVYTDIRYKTICIPLSVIIGIMGVIFSICNFFNINFGNTGFFGIYFPEYTFSEHTSPFSFVISISISILIFIVSLLTKDSIGKGDSIMAAVLACYICPSHIIAILLYGFIFSGIFALFLIILKRKKRNDIIPFAPFLLSGHICYFLLFYL